MKGSAKTHEISLRKIGKRFKKKRGIAVMAIRLSRGALWD